MLRILSQNLTSSYIKGQKTQNYFMKFDRTDKVLKYHEMALQIPFNSYIILWRLVCEKMSNQYSFCKGVSSYGFSSDKRTADAPQDVP